MAQNDRSLQMESLAEEIRSIYRSCNTSAAEAKIGDYVEMKLQGYPLSERLAIMQNLDGLFTDAARGSGFKSEPEKKEFARLFSMVLGRKLSTEDLSSPELMDKLAVCLVTVFDTLNEIIGLIHSNLFGEKSELETIRHIIGSNLTSDAASDSLQNYLDKIRQGFLIAHRAFQEAAATKAGQILSELEPKQIAAASESGMKFGPFRKAELFDIYSQKHQKCQKYFDSGRFVEEVLREFEKNCRKQFRA